MARKLSGRRQLQDAEREPALRERYGTVIARIAALSRRHALAPLYSAFLLWGNRSNEIGALPARHCRRRTTRGTGRECACRHRCWLRQRLIAIGDRPAGLERRLLSARLQDFLASFPAEHPIRRAAVGTSTADAAADRLLKESVFASVAATRSAAEQNQLARTDPALAIVSAASSMLNELQAKQRQLAVQESDLAAQLGRARFEVYGTMVPPDGSGSPRIADGVVKSYEYNGTLAPAYTTFYGVYDRFYAHGPDSDWNLPARWVPAPAALDLNTPLNFVSTADTYGGNSGSPAVTSDMEIVGLNFDRNIEGLSRNFIFLPERGRNIMVDVRAIREALDDVYDADRIVMELLNHRAYATEAEADSARK
jgi:hypothetical protein